ncbi:hypothetical protein COCCADRAFT_106975 [Bipolaris zeicola 26-R-13]|uniref:Uncharacterized protein n=1 Tax=Cochliobolus carbonum (strain 26-R-13) TaxID=930089 RepID=W6XPJ1_COCC2|nr:uncharacterized protein COCCADRAFT_106975 [Bipolaris zeicola 26-R-13]EUC29267.1 hypothetical protein COCCADRAFT_106975 [Bipolaris zeicola 26-R-13]
MRVLIAAIALLSIFSDPTSAHPSVLDPRAQTKNINIPIGQILQNSKVEKSGKGTQGPLKFKGTLPPELKSLYKSMAPKPDPLKESKMGQNVCLGDPCCTKYNDGKVTPTPFFEVSEWSQHLGIPRRISEPLCPPGSVTNSRTISYTYSINVNIGPDLKFGPSILDKFGIRVGFAYTWGTATTVGYTAACTDGGNYPCYSVFTPRIGVIKGWGYIANVGTGGFICSKGPRSFIEIHVPVVPSDTCNGGDRNPCGPSGVYDHCFATGPQAAALCPRSSLDLKHPPSRSCPNGITGQP